MSELMLPAAALIPLLYSMYNGSKGAPKQTSRRRKSKGPRGTSSTSFSPENKSDLSVRPPSSRVPTKVPRTVTNLVVWDVVSIDTTILTSTTTLVESNFGFTLSQHPQAASWQALFDQWCIPQVSVTFQSLMPPGATSTESILYTSLDFDNIVAINTIQAIEDFSTCETHLMGPRATHVRSIRPCNKLSALNFSGTNNNSAMSRTWVDSASPGTEFFGIRSILSGTTNAYPIVAKITLWYAFRNQI
jgi:hypothetical protein